MKNKSIDVPLWFLGLTFVLPTILAVYNAKGMLGYMVILIIFSMVFNFFIAKQHLTMKFFFFVLSFCLGYPFIIFISFELISNLDDWQNYMIGWGTSSAVYLYLVYIFKVKN